MQNLIVMETEVRELILNKFGIRAATHLTTIGAPTVLTQVQHEAVEAAREDVIQSPESLITRNAELAYQLAACQNKLQALETYVKANLPP